MSSFTPGSARHSDAAASPSAGVAPPVIHLTDVPLGYGEKINHWSLTLNEARQLRALLLEAIVEYEDKYGETP